MAAKNKDKLQASIDKHLADLLDGKIEATKAESLRKDLLLAIKWQAVKQKRTDAHAWGAAFGNGTGTDDE